MSGLLGRTPATASRRRRRGPHRRLGAARAPRRLSRSTRCRCGWSAFAALAAFGLAHWACCVAGRSGRADAVVLLVATGGGALLALLGRAPHPPGPRAPARAGRRDRDAGARADGGRPARAPAAARALGRVLRRPRPRPCGHPVDRVALRRARRVGPPDGAARRRRRSSRSPRCSPSGRLAARRRGAAGRWASSTLLLSLRHVGGRARSRRAGAPRARAARRWWPPGCGCRGCRAARRASRRRGGAAAWGCSSLPLAAALDRTSAWWDYRLELVRGRQGPHASTGTTPTGR